MFVFWNPCARANLHQQKRALKLCSATLMGTVNNDCTRVYGDKRTTQWHEHLMHAIIKATYFIVTYCFNSRTIQVNWALPGAIIGDGDRKRALFLVLGLAPWYGTIFLFLEQIAPSPVAHARTCCEDFCGCRAGKMASEIPEISCTFGPLLNTFMSVRIVLKYFRRKLLQFEWRKTVSNLGMSRFISLTRLCSAASFTRTSHYSTLNFIYVED